MTLTNYSQVNPGDVNLHIAVNVIQKPNVIQIGSKVNPYRFLAMEGDTYSKTRFETICQAALQKEVALKSLRSHNAFRSELANMVGVPSIPVGTNDTSITTVKGFLNVKRLRRQQIPISIIVYVTSTLLAYNETYSSMFKEKMIGMRIPKIYIEQFKRVRKSQCGTYYITPGLQDDTYKVIEAIPYLKSTLLDPNFLYSEDGLSCLCSFLAIIASISQDDESYFQLTALDDRTLFPYSSGMQTTFNSLSKHNNTVGYIETLQHNSYKSGSPTMVHVLDSMIMDQITTAQGSSSYYQCTFSSALELSFGSETELIYYIVLRSMGVITNDLGLDTPNGDKPEDHPSGPASTASDENAKLLKENELLKKKLAGVNKRRRKVPGKNNEGANNGGKSGISGERIFDILGRLIRTHLKGKQITVTFA